MFTLKFVSNLVLTLSLMFTLFLLIPLVPVVGQWYQLAIVQSASMEPFLPVGSVAIYQSRETYHPGEVIAYHNGDGDDVKTIIHRIVEKNKHPDGSQTYLTQGDATAYLASQPVFPGQVQGKLVAVIPRAGYVFNWFQSTTGIAAVMFVPLAFLVIYELTKLP